MKLIETIRHIIHEQEGPSPNEWELKQNEVMRYINLFKRLEIKDIDFPEFDVSNDVGKIVAWDVNNKIPELENVEFELKFDYDVFGPYDDINAIIIPGYLIIKKYNGEDHETIIYYGSDFTDILIDGRSPIHNLVEQHLIDEYNNREPNY